MKVLFPGYFTPTDAEFEKLWRECVFAFDANVLLGLYRSTSETQEIFFAVLEKIRDRIFLPHQAASEYLRNRLDTISKRAKQYGTIRIEAEKLTKAVNSIVQQHSILNGEGIAKIAADSAEKLIVAVDAAEAGELDLLRDDSVLARLAEMFDGKTGRPFDGAKLKEIYGEGAERYAQGVPPGYKDDKKPEPAKYGDLLIWFQLIEHAKQEKKPVLFVSGDVKEDWLLQHEGEAMGTRPELRQEMMGAAGVDFYTYTTPRFLEFARQFLGLALDTKPAQSEFEQIEKQDKQAAEMIEITPTEWQYMNYLPTADWGPQPQVWGQPAAFALKNTTYPYGEWSMPLDFATKNKYFELLPVHGQTYNSPAGKWKCEIVSHPNSDEYDQVNYGLKFDPEDHSRPTRQLKVWVSLGQLECDSDWGYKRAIFSAISKWLGTTQGSGEISQFA